MIIYKAQNKINGKIYIGQTVESLAKRISCHLCQKTYFGNALRKYGVESFDILQIDSADSKQSLNAKEINWIAFYKSKAPNGYNLTDGGEGNFGFKHSEEFKSMIRERFKGRFVSEDVRKKIREANKNFRHSEEAKKKIGEANSRRIVSLETRIKQHENTKNYWLKRKEKLNEYCKRTVGVATGNNEKRIEIRGV